MMVGRKREYEYIGVMMAKKFRERRTVFQLKMASRTQCHENDSVSTVLVVEPLESSSSR